MNVILYRKTVTISLGIFILVSLVAVIKIQFFSSSTIFWDDGDISKSGVDETTEIFDNSNLSQNDTNILEYLRKYYLLPPSTNEEPNYRNGWNPSEWAHQLNEIFENKRNGVFIEAGANDGEFLSNTLTFERDFGWSGLLIEANNIIFPKLQKRNRKSWIANVCLAVKPYPHKVNILHRVGNKDWYKGNGIIEPNSDVPPPPDHFNRSEYISAGITECFPLFSLLSAINMTKIDYFSLDVEGVEMKILKTIPFDCVDIKVISVEHNVAEEGKEAIRDFLIFHGYETYMETPADFIFVQKGYLNPKSKSDNLY